LIWRTSKRELNLDRPLVMAILNVTPDSFSDAGEIMSVDDALRRADECVAQGADILDIGGESTRPGSARVPAEVEIRRVVPAIEAIAKRFDVPISVDTSKSEVAAHAVDAGAEIINDISGLRWDPEIAAIAAETDAGLIVMHSRGEFDTMHLQPPVNDILSEVSHGLRESVASAHRHGVMDECIALDVGIGFGKTPEQNLELIAKLDKLIKEFPSFPFVIGLSRKSFIGKLLDLSDPADRVSGSVAAASLAVANGARIVRAHDVRATREAVLTAAAIIKASC
jgi:dihydropteroate synthase